MLVKVIKKFIVANPEEWALLNHQSNEWLDPLLPLSHYELKHMVGTAAF